MLLVDTDVLIWQLRGYPQATRRIDALGAPTLSAAGCLEVLRGIRNKAELVAVKKMLAHRTATLLPGAEAIAQRAFDRMESLSLSHGLPVLTANVKHFGAVEGLEVEALIP